MVRSKFRFLTVKISSRQKENQSGGLHIKNADLFKSIISKVKKIHGDFGVAAIKTGFNCRYCNESTGIAILKCRFGPHRFMASVLAFILKIGNEHVQIQMIRKTATLHQAYIYLKIYQRKELEKFLKTAPDVDVDEVSASFSNLTEVEQMLMRERKKQIEFS